MTRFKKPHLVPWETMFRIHFRYCYILHRPMTLQLKTNGLTQIQRYLVVGKGPITLCTKSTKISSLFPKRGNRNTKRTEKHKNKMTHGKTYNKSPRRMNHKSLFLPKWLTYSSCLHKSKDFHQKRLCTAFLIKNHIICLCGEKNILTHHQNMPI